MNLAKADPTRRFSDRVADYARHRPTYPPAMLDFLRDAVGLAPDWLVADVGCGTGISSELFLRNGNAVIGVEPNAAMRQAADAGLARYPKFRSVDGTAEATTLAGASVDMVVAAQAFHWFDIPRAAAEFRRILRGPRALALMWNTRKTDATPFLAAYEQLLREYGTDYNVVRHDTGGPSRIADLFGAVPYRTATIPNEQRFDFDGLRGRLLSSSYAPAAGHPRHAPMLAALRDIFDRYQTGGAVVFIYDTEVYAGRMEPASPPR